jgi:GR25 family glycosyltransferase involved in LPS biosynthesis
VYTCNDPHARASGYIWSTAGYAITPALARKMVKDIEGGAKIDKPVDLWMWK